MDKIKVLFVCIHNSARSQMAEALLNKMAGDRFQAFSAGIEPGTLNPLVVEVMKEIGIDISANKTKSVFDFHKKGEWFNYVITVCDKKAGERCPLFPGVIKQIHMGFADPSVLEGTQAARLEATRKIRDEIESVLKEWVKSI